MGDYLVRWVGYPATRRPYWEVSKWGDKNEPEIVYEVRKTGRGFRCNCPSNRPSCKHIDLVKQYEKDPRSEYEMPKEFYHADLERFASLASEPASKFALTKEEEATLRRLLEKRRKE